MKYSFKAEMELFGKKNNIGKAEGKDKFVPSDVTAELINMCIPHLNAIAGTDGRVLLTGEMYVDDKKRGLQMYLEAAAIKDEAWERMILQFVRSFRNWIIKEFRPEYEAVL